MRTIAWVLPLLPQLVRPFFVSLVALAALTAGPGAAAAQTADGAPAAAAENQGADAKPARRPGAKVGKRAGGAKTAKTAKAAAVRPITPPRPRPAAYELLLTFDDGPRLDTTPKVLDALDKYNIKSVFFVNGVRFMGKGPQHDKLTALMRETMKRGHVIGNHTIHHLFLCGKRGPVVAEKEILDNAQYIRDAVGVAPPLFRTPYGSHCPSLSATLNRLGITPIAWDIDPQDWKLQNADAIFEFMKKELTSLRRARSIVLFHDVQPATVEMLPRFLDWVASENLARKGRGEPPFKFIDYSFLLQRVGAAPPPVLPNPASSSAPTPAPVPTSTPIPAPTPAPAPTP